MFETYVYKKTAYCQLKGDLYAVANNNRPLIIYIHGGGLIWGTRKDIDSRQIELYKEAGYNVFSIDYRLAPETKLKAILEDVEDAISWLINESPLQFNRSKVVVIGSSAGAYLALNSATFKHKPQAIVSFYGYASISGNWYGRPSDYYLRKQLVPESLVRKLINKEEICQGPIEKRYAIYLYCRQQGKWIDYVVNSSADHSAEDLEQYSPINKIDNSFPPTYLLHGNNDEDVPHEQAVELAKAFESKGVNYKFRTIENGKHTFDREMSQEQLEQMIKDIISFLDENI